MQRREHRGHVVVHRSAIGGRHAGQMRLPKHAAVHASHDEERRADHARRRRTSPASAAPARVPASAFITRYSRSTACADGNSWPGGFLRKHVVAIGGVQEIRRVRLAAFELTDLERASKPLEVIRRDSARAPPRSISCPDRTAVVWPRTASLLMTTARRSYSLAAAACAPAAAAPSSPARSCSRSPAAALR